MSKLSRKRTAEQKAAEEMLVVRTLLELFSSRRLPPCLPQLAGTGGTTQQQAYDVEVAPGITFGSHLSDSLIAAINSLRHTQRYALTIGDRPSLISNVLAPMRSRYGWDDPARFKLMASSLGIELSEHRHSLRQSGFTDRGLGSLPTTSRPHPQPEPESKRHCMRSTPGTRSAVEQDEIERLASLQRDRFGDALSTLDAEQLRLIGAVMTPEAVAQILMGCTQTEGAAETLADALPTSLREQLAPEPPTAETATQCDIPPPPPLSVALEALSCMSQEDQLALLDRQSAELLGSRFQHILRRCVVAMKRISIFRDRDGVAQANFVASMLETYGADESERLPFGSMLTWFMYYSTRVGADLYWGSNLSGMPFKLDGGWYEEAWRDFKFVAGNAAVQFLRGPMFSGMVKGGQVSKGIYILKDMPFEERDERIFLGAGIPSVRALNGQPKPEDVIKGGGMSPPLKRAMQELAGSYHRSISKLVGRELPRLDAQLLTERLAPANAAAFDEQSVDRAIHGDDSEAQLVFPKPPDGGWPPSKLPWWAAAPQEVAP